MAVYRMCAMRRAALARRAAELGDKSAPAWDGLANALTAVGMDKEARRARGRAAEALAPRGRQRGGDGPSEHRGLGN